jgi:hypothetical protein
MLYRAIDVNWRSRHNPEAETALIHSTEQMASRQLLLSSLTRRKDSTSLSLVYFKQ